MDDFRQMRFRAPPGMVGAVPAFRVALALSVSERWVREREKQPSVGPEEAASGPIVPTYAPEIITEGFPSG